MSIGCPSKLKNKFNVIENLFINDWFVVSQKAKLLSKKKKTSFKKKKKILSTHSQYSNPSQLTFQQSSHLRKFSSMKKK
jgi:hypothetical protein